MRAWRILITYRYRDRLVGSLGMHETATATVKVSLYLTVIQETVMTARVYIYVASRIGDGMVRLAELHVPGAWWQTQLHTR